MAGKIRGMSFSEGVTVSDPSSLDVGFAAGQKQYTEADVTFSNTPAGWDLKRATFIPYQLIDGSWRMQFSVSALTNSLSSRGFDIDGILTKNIVGAAHTCSAASEDPNKPTEAYMLPNSNSVEVISQTADIHVIVFGDIELDAQPSWATGETSNLITTSSATVVLNGDFIGGNRNVHFRKIANQVTMSFEGIPTWAADDFASSLNGLVPSEFRPIINKYNLYIADAASVYSIRVSEIGLIQIHVFSWAGGVSNVSNSLAAASITYLIT